MGHKNIVKVGYQQLKAQIQTKLEDIQRSSGRKFSDLIGKQEEILPETYKELVETYNSRFVESPRIEDQVAFLQGAKIAIDAAITYISRIAELARESAAKTQDPVRKKELEKIAQTCQWVAINPPRDFREAIQLVWFNHVIATISHGMTGVLAIGRADQYLFPFFEADSVLNPFP